MWTIFVTSFIRSMSSRILVDLHFIKIFHVLAKSLFALFASKGHFSSPHQGVLLLFSMALGAIEPLPTCPWDQPLAFLSADVDSQHGDRIDTCAFNICLLERSGLEYSLNPLNLPHGVLWMCKSQLHNGRGNNLEFLLDTLYFLIGGKSSERGGVSG